MRTSSGSGGPSSTTVGWAAAVVMKPFDRGGDRHHRVPLFKRPDSIPTAVMGEPFVQPDAGNSYFIGWEAADLRNQAE